MQDRPTIATAIPKRRFQIGDYSASLLGEVESNDRRHYRYILALVPTGERRRPSMSPARPPRRRNPRTATIACG